MKIFMGLYLWSCFTLLVSKTFIAYGFTGGIYLFLLGVPMIIVYFIYSSDGSFEIVSKNIDEFKTGEEIQRYIRYFMYFVDEKNNEKDIEIFLKGLIYYHEESCLNADCPLKHYIEHLENLNIPLNQEVNSVTRVQNPNTYLYKYADTIYLIGLSKFPNCTSLRLAYALFLWERFKNKNGALLQFSEVEKYDPSFPEEFIIFRYRKIIGEEEEEMNNTGEVLDVISEIEYESHFNLCKLNIINVAGLYQEFWDQLGNSQSQEITKLNELGLRINSTNTAIEIHWNSMQDLKPNNSKAVILYGDYVLNLLNNKEKGTELVNFWKEHADKKQTSSGIMNVDLDEIFINYIKEGNAIILCSAESDFTFGRIHGISKEACKIFGYSEKEITVSKNIEFLFIQNYSNGRLHNWLNEQLTATSSDSSPEFFAGKNKNNKVVSLYIKPYQYKSSKKSQKYFLLFLKNLEKDNNDLKKFIDRAHYIVDSNKRLLNLNSFGQEFINKLNRFDMQNRMGVIHEIFPELIKYSYLNYQEREETEENQFLQDDDPSKTNEMINFNFLDISENETFKIEFEKNVDPNKAHLDYEPKIYTGECTIRQLQGLKQFNQSKNSYEKSNDLKLFDIQFSVAVKSDTSKDIKTEKDVKIVDKRIIQDMDIITSILNENEGLKIIDLWKKDEKESKNYNPFEQLYKVTDGSTTLNDYYSKYFAARAQQLENEESEESEFSSGEEEESDEGSDSSSFKMEIEKKKRRSSIIESLQIAKVDSNVVTAFQLLNNQEYLQLKSDEYYNLLVNKLQDFGKNITSKKRSGETWEDVTNIEYMPKVAFSLKSRSFQKDEDEVKETKKVNKKSKNQLEYSKIKNRQQTPQSLKSLKIVSIIILVFISLYGAGQYKILSLNLSKYSLNFKMLNLSFSALYDLHIVTYSIRNLILLQNETYKNFNDFNKSYFTTMNLNNIYSYEQKLSITNQLITNSTLWITDVHKRLFLEPNVSILIFQGSDNTVVNYNYNLLYSFDVQLSFILNLLPGGMNVIKETNQMIMEFFYNNFNDFIEKLYTSTSLYLDLLSYNTFIDNIIQYSYVGLFVIVVIGSTIQMNNLLSRVEIERKNILLSFYHIPTYYVKFLSAKCGKFLANHNKGDDNPAGSDDEADEELNNMSLEELESLYGENKKRHLAKDKLSQGNDTNLPRITIVFLLIFTFFAILLVTNVKLTKNLEVLNRIYNATSIIYFHQTRNLNLLREKYVNNRGIITNSDNDNNLEEKIVLMFKECEAIYNIHQINSNIFDSTYIANFQNFYNGNLCNIEKLSSNIPNCEYKANSIAKFGFKLVSNKYNRLLYNAFKTFKDLKSKDSQFYSSSYVSKLNQPLFNELSILNFDFLRNSLQHISESLFKVINNAITEQNTFNTGVFAMFLIFMIGGYLFIYLPFEKSLQDDILQTKMMLNIIPDEIITNVDELNKVIA